jgi:hypothetical protein
MLLKITIPTKSLLFYSYPSLLYFSIVSLLFLISLIHLVSLLSSFSIFFLPFNTCFLSLRSHISISPSFFFLLHSLYAGTLEFRLSYTRHTPYCIWIFSFSPFFLACLCLFHSGLHSSIFLSLLIFLLLHCHNRFSLSFFSVFFFIASIPLVFCTLPFHTFFIQTLPLSFPLSLSACSFYTLPSLCNLTFLCRLLAPLSNIFLALSLPLLVPSIPRSLSRTSVYSLSHIALPYFLFEFLTIPLICPLSVALSLNV